MPTFRYVVTMNYSAATGTPGVNVWHGRTTTGLPGAGVEAAALVQMIEDFYDQCSEVYPSGVSIVGASELSGVGDDAGDETPVTPWTITGSGGSSFLPPANCLLVDWRTSTGGRRGRGRSFLGPICDTSLEGNGTPVEASRTAVQAAADELIESSDSFANGAWGVYSRTDETLRDFVTASVPNMFAVLRSRRD